MLNSKQQGAVGVAVAVAYFTKQGYAVFVPVSDVSRYDLVVDDGTGPKRVEVKTTRGRSVQLRTITHNSVGFNVHKRISTEDCELVFCYNIKSDVFKIFNSVDLEGRSTITVK